MIEDLLTLYAAIMIFVFLVLVRNEGSWPRDWRRIVAVSLAWALLVVIVIVGMLATYAGLAIDRLNAWRYDEPKSSKPSPFDDGPGAPSTRGR